MNPTILEIETYQPSPKQIAFHEDRAKFLLLLGAWRAGKSLAMVWEIIMTAIQYPGCRIGLFRRTYPALRDTTWQDLLDNVPVELLDQKECKRSEGREKLAFINYSTVIGRCLDDWRKLGSMSFDLIVVDEANEIEQMTFEMLAKGRLSGKVGPRRMILATNPPNRDHWLHKVFVEQAAENSAVHHFATYDNYHICTKPYHVSSMEEVNGAHDPDDYCLRRIDDTQVDGSYLHYNLPPGYIEELRAMPENRRRRFLDGEWGFTAVGTPVFTEFQDSRHIAALKPQRGIPIIRGWDFGYHSPFVVWLQILPTGHIHVLRELKGSDVPVRDFCERVIAETNLYFPNYSTVDYCDVAGVIKNDMGVSSIRVLNEHDIHPSFRKLSIWKTIEGIRDLLSRTRLGVPLLRFNVDCTWLREAFEGGYILKVNANGTEEPFKDGTYDHGVDALRYALADIFTPMVGIETKSHRLYQRHPRIDV